MAVKINRKVKNYSINKNDLNTYYNVGKLLLEAGKNYGERVIKEYSIKLTSDLNIRYDVSSLNKMRKFYCLIVKMATVSPNLSYSHYVELLPYNDLNKVNYYIKIIEEQNLSIRQLRTKKILYLCLTTDVSNCMYDFYLAYYLILHCLYKSYPTN